RRRPVRAHGAAGRLRRRPSGQSGLRSRRGAWRAPLPDGGRSALAGYGAHRPRPASSHRRLAGPAHGDRARARTDHRMIRIGVDFGGTKIEAAALDGEGRFQARVRAPNPGDYEAAPAVVRDLVAEAEREAGAQGSIGIGAPGSVSPKTGLMRNANSVYLNGRPFREDLEKTLGRPVRMANDANCFALSEAMDGAAAGAGVVFAAILGTGCGGGLVANGKLIEGRNGVGGEWGHNPLPRPRADELPAALCWC